VRPLPGAVPRSIPICVWVHTCAPCPARACCVRVCAFVHTCICHWHTRANSSWACFFVFHCKRAHARAHTHSHTHTHIHTYTHTHTHTHKQAHTNTQDTRVHAHARTRVGCVCVHTHTATHARTHAHARLLAPATAATRRAVKSGHPEFLVLLLAGMYSLADCCESVAILADLQPAAPPGGYT
jgi:hypothetical protein